MPSTPLKPGIYRHFKGQNYEVIDVAYHSETEEAYVVYRALYGEKQLWIRPLQHFLESVNRENHSIPRFKYIGTDTEKSIDT